MGEPLYIRTSKHLNGLSITSNSKFQWVGGEKGGRTGGRRGSDRRTFTRERFLFGFKVVVFDLLSVPYLRGSLGGRFLVGTTMGLKFEDRRSSHSFI